MRTSHHGLAFAALAALTAFGTLSIADEAHAGGKYKNGRGLTIVIGDGYPAYGYGYRSFGRSYGCGWLLDRYEDTGSSKWYKRWHQCKYGW